MSQNHLFRLKLIIIIRFILTLFEISHKLDWLIGKSEIRVSGLVSMVFRLLVYDAQGKGKRRVISRSNSKNIIATRKNFMEKGKCAEPIVSNLRVWTWLFCVYTYLGGVRMW